MLEQIVVRVSAVETVVGFQGRGTRARLGKSQAATGDLRAGLDILGHRTDRIVRGAGGALCSQVHVQSMRDCVRCQAARRHWSTMLHAADRSRVLWGVCSSEAAGVVLVADGVAAVLAVVDVEVIAVAMSQKIVCVGVGTCTVVSSKVVHRLRDRSDDGSGRALCGTRRVYPRA